MLHTHLANSYCSALRSLAANFSLVPSFDDMMFCMAAFYKIGGTEEFAKAKYLYKSHSKGRVARIFALFCLNQNEIDQAVEIVNLDYCLKR